MEALHIQPFEEPRVMTENQEDEKSVEPDDAGMEASSATGSTTEEETDEDSEPEPPPVIRRKVSFADAFGLNLVSVKEFDNADVTESEVSWSKGREVTRSAEEFYLSCLFTVPASQEELDQRLHAQMIELESIEILPGTTVLRGIIRVLNLCYSKSVYARISLDRWRSYFDLLAEYVPGSSDRKTDRFTFKYTLVPPFETGGTRIEFCLRYETPEGMFWANNNEMNYVLFCHQKGQTSMTQTDEESSIYRSKRSCLKANRNGDAEEKIRGTYSTYILAAAEVEAAPKLEKSGRETTNAAETLLHNEEQKPWVESVKSRRRETRLARVQDYLFKTMQQQLNDSAHVQKVSQHMPAPWGNSGSLPYECQKIQSSESLQVLTYHQIPLLPLDWNNDPPQRCETADVDDILAGRPKMTLSNASEEKPVNDMWETTDKANSKEASVSDVWQAFLNGPGSEDRSDVPESEWLQTAVSVSPSNDREPQIQYSAESQEFQELQAGTETATASHTLAACQLLSDTCEQLSTVVSLNTKDHQLKVACVSSPGDNTATQAASQRSQTNSETDAPLDFSLKTAPPVSEGSDSPTECHEQEVWEQECEGIIAPGIGGDEPFTLHTADLVTSSRESETTDMTAVPESHNANTGDMISEGARQDEGLSSSGEQEVTATAHNASDDMLAFRETIGQETKDEARNVFFASRQEVEEEIMLNYSENKVSREEEIFRPEKTEDKVERQEAGQKGEGKEIIILDEQACQNNDKVLQVSSSGQMEKILILEACGTHVQKREDLALKETEESADLKSETGEHVLDSNLLGDKNRLSWEGKAMEQKEICPSANFKPIVDTMESKKIFQISRDTARLGRMDKCKPNPLEVVKLRWTHSQQELKSQNDGLSSEISPEDVTAKKNAPKRDTLTGHQPEASGGTEEELIQEDKSICIGKLETEAMREMMGNAKSPQIESQNAWKEQELSAEAESSPIGEYKKPSIGTKEPITAVNSVALEVVEPRMEQMAIERFGEDLVSKIWEEIFVQEEQTSSRRTNTVDEMRNMVAGAMQGCHFLFEHETFDSGVFSLTKLPTDLNVSLGQAQEQTSASESKECSTNDRSQALPAKQKTPIVYKLQTDLNSSPQLSHDLTTTSAAQIGEPLFQSTQALNSPKDQENCSQIKAKSVTRQETDSQTEACVFTRRKSSDRSSNLSNKHLGSSEKLKESDALLWWTILYTISHLTRLLICTLLVGGFFVVVFLYDFPAFFAFYLFSMCWWVYTWKRHRVTADNGITG